MHMSQELLIRGRKLHRAAGFDEIAQLGYHCCPSRW